MMRRALRTTGVLALSLLALAALASPAMAQFGFQDFDFTISNEDGSPATQAGSHPFAVSTSLRVNTKLDGGFEVPEGETKNLIAQLPEGFAGIPAATPRCSTAQFIDFQWDEEEGISGSGCPDATAVGVNGVQINFSPFLPGETGSRYVPIFNMVPPPGVAAKLGTVVLGEPISIEVGLSDSPPYRLIATTKSIPQILLFYSAQFTLWGNPANEAHDPLRGSCVGPLFGVSEEPLSRGLCPVNIPEIPLITLPRSCEGPLTAGLEANSWETPGTFVKETAVTHDDAVPPNPLGTTGCGNLKFAPEISSQATSSSAESGSGLDFDLDVEDEGLTNPTGIANSDIKKAVVTLPKGVTINPSVGEGLNVCSPQDLKRETAFSAPGAGCPNGSNLGTLHVTTPLVDEPIDGSIYLAEQDDPATTSPGAENPFDSLIALYFVLKNPTLGVSVKLPVKVEPDPSTGQLVVTLEDSPQLPIGHFNAHLRTGARAALVTPGACGAYTTKALLTPWANPAAPVTKTSSFEITSGLGGGPCPPGGVPPFKPDFEAGSINNNAGSFSPFNMRLIREDGEQDMTKFSAILPPGELGSLAGVDKCPDSAVAIAKAKTGKQELASPSCPANSLIGHTLAGAGVGSALTYVGGQVYLAGAYNGDPLSVIAITPAVAGPFDAGTVVVRLALTLNPKTAEVEVDGANSDPIPHILKGIVLKVRDLRVYVDRPNFTLNPTSCDESRAKSVLFGSYLDVLSPVDDVPIDLASRFQAANCLNLGFKPGLKLNLKGGTRRGGHPALQAIYTPKKGDANIKGLVVRLPRSAFLDQAHIKTICTRVQFAAKSCPAKSQYGYIKAWTPLLDAPLEGPVYLRSSSHKLPDLVFDLHGLVDIEVSVRIDSAHGGIRATLEDAPDAPLSKVELRMQGAKKGLIINSRNLCGSTNRANVEFTGQNGKEFKANPAMKPECGGRKHKRHP